MTSDQPNWETYPNLDGVITKSDVSVKGSGKFSAAYVNHMKVSQLLRQHAPGWQFELLTTTDDDNRETVVFRAPDGTGMLRGFFRAPTGSGFMDTPPMPQAIMDHRNSPIKWEDIDARDITDTERRCMCIVAARHFGLAYELWAKDPVEDPHRELQPEPKQQQSTPKAKPKAESPKATRKMPAQAESVATPEVDPIAEGQADCAAALRDIYQGNQDFDPDPSVAQKWAEAVKNRWDGQINAEKPTVQNLTTTEQLKWCFEWITAYQRKIKVPS